MTIHTLSFYGFSMLNKTPKQCLDTFDFLLRSGSFHHFLTLNPEIFTRCDALPRLKRDLQDSCLCTADGVGVRLASRLLLNQPLVKCTGLDLVDTLLGSNRFSIFFVGSTTQSLDIAIHSIRQRFPKVVIKGAHHGFFPEDHTDSIIDLIRDAEPDIVLTGMGFPKQDHFLRACQNTLNYGIGIGVGGVIDIFSHQKKRMPNVIRKMGLEWLFQGLFDIKRMKRWWHIGPGFIRALMRS